MNDLVTAAGNVSGPVCILLVGLPGVGKSTWRESLGTNFVFLSTDDYAESVAERAGKNYDDVWQLCIDDATKVMNEEFAEAIREHQSITVDRTNLTVKSRRKFLAQLPREYTKVAVYFEVEEAVRQERLKARVGKTIPDSADKAMRRNYTRPTTLEGFDMIISGVA